MFTVKVCSGGIETYFETDAVSREVLDTGSVLLRFSAQNEERHILFPGLSGNMERPPEDVPTADRAYIMNAQGKTIEAIR